MKRTIIFKLEEEQYAFVEDDKTIFNINKNDLNFDVKSFYIAFFGNDLDITEIVLENTLEKDKNATRVFMCVQQLIIEICDKINTTLIEYKEEDLKE